ncbi:MAG TPA: AMIN domain-containing protein, partial [Anaeromyxobacteraceae bacterium]|nr:AMIN domain-containing protein [Anaeromyxobacteraceae bacterium]
MDTIQNWHARRLLAGLVAAGALATVPARAAAPVPNVIRAIDVAERGGAVELDIRGSRAPSYTVFKLQDPPRLVVDVAGGDVSALSSPLGVSRRGVLSVTTAQYKDEKSAVGRIIVALEPQARYEVTPRGESVVVRIQSGEALASPAQAQTAKGATAAVPGATQKPAVALVATTMPSVAATATPAAASPTRTPSPSGGGRADSAEAARGEGASRAAPVQDNVVSRRMDAVTVRRPATVLKGARV